MIVRKLALPLLVSISVLVVTTLSCSAAGNLPNPFASATPTITPTFTPSATPSPTPTFTPTFTPTATPQTTGMAIHKLPGGSSQFLDYDAGVTIDIPSDWVAVKLDPEDIRAAMSSMSKSNPALSKALENVLQSDSSGFRIFAFDKRPSDYGEGFVSNFNVAMSDDPMATGLPLEMLVQSSLAQIKRQLPTAKPHDLGSKTTTHGLDLRLVELQLSLKLPGGTLAKIYEKQIYFQTQKALVVITFSAPADKATLITPLFDKIMDQIQLMKP